MRKEFISPDASTRNLEVYLAYLLRYAAYPVSIAQLQKLAKARHFGRLAQYFGELDPSLMYESAEEAREHFRQQTLQNR